MPSHRISDIGSLIVKSGPYNKPLVIAKPSYAKGVTPEHLKPFTEKFTPVAKECAAATRDMPPGKEKIIARRACIGQKLKR